MSATLPTLTDQPTGRVSASYQRFVKLRVLVGCERFGVVRDAFLAAGHDAWSCDLVASERQGQHLRCDVLDVLDDGWDLAIFHPDCTYLASSGLHWNKRRPGRSEKTEQALEFVRKLLAAPIQHIALENPVGCISTRIRKPDQIIQPWQYGHPESKATCLWLKNLPRLAPTTVLPLPDSGRWANQTPSGQNKLPPSEGRAMERARTYAGIAAAMAEQWTKHINHRTKYDRGTSIRETARAIGLGGPTQGLGPLFNC